MKNEKITYFPPPQGQLAMKTTRETITVKQFRRAKKRFESRVEDLIAEFHEETGGKVESVEVTWNDVRKYGFDPDDACDRFAIFSVNASVRL